LTFQNSLNRFVNVGLYIFADTPFGLAVPKVVGVGKKAIVTRGLRVQRREAGAEGPISKSDQIRLETAGANVSADQLLTGSAVEVADKAGCKVRELNQRFRKQFGMSLVAVRMELRLLKAAALLRETNASLREIAEGCGFGHVGLFGVCFERRFETTPMQWRAGGKE